jgi:alpha-galactosidase
LNQFGSAIAEENKITKLKPADFKGWATWDYYGRVFTPKDIYGNMNQLNTLAPEANMVQIDGGWWTERGDYKSLRPDLLPGGLKEIVARITSEGKTPGLHFDGFRGDANSEIYKAHPEYFLHDQDGKLIVEVNSKSERVIDLGVDGQTTCSFNQFLTFSNLIFIFLFSRSTLSSSQLE